MHKTKVTGLISLLALAATVIATVPSHATTFDISTLNDYQTGSGRQIVDHGYYTGLNGTGTYVFNSAGVQQNPWTQSLGNPDQASINFSVPTMGNNGGKIYTTAGGLFPIPTGQVLGQNENGYSGDYNLGSYPMYFAFSNPTYDNNCGFNCNTITQDPVTLDSLYLSGAVAGDTITGYSDLGHTVIDTITLTGSGLQKIQLDWTGIEEVSISGSGYYLNDIEVNDPLPAATPEPSSLILLGTGLLGISVIVRRKLCV
jgi:hypothetical protein